MLWKEALLVYVYPAKKALAAVMANVKTMCRRNTNLMLADLLAQLPKRYRRGRAGLRRS